MNALANAFAVPRFDSQSFDSSGSQAMGRNSAWTMLELLPQAVLVLARDRTVLVRNQRTQRLLQDQCLQIADGRLITLGQLGTLQIAQMLRNADASGGCDCGIWFEKSLSTGWLRALATPFPESPGDGLHGSQGAVLLVIQIDQPALAQCARIDVLAQTCHLSPTERHVLMLLADGMTVELAARHLCLQLSTLRSHVRNLLGKTQAPSLMQLLRWTGSASTQPH
jgi:DNA-binding CsgD family transcriptional regulator